MKTKPWAMILVIAITLVIPVAQVLLKQGSAFLNLTVAGLLLNWKLIIGAILYVTASFLLIFALKNGELSVLYPLFGLNYVWVTMAAFFIIGEAVTLFQSFGIGIIVVSTALVGLSSKEASS